MTYNIQIQDLHIHTYIHNVYKDKTHTNKLVLTHKLTLNPKILQ